MKWCYDENGEIHTFIQFFYVQFFNVTYGIELRNEAFIYSCQKRMFLQLFEEVRNVLPLNFKGERRTLTSMGNINDNVINCNANQCFITWIEVKPFHLFGDNIQHCSDFFCDESILKNENDLDLFTETNSFTNLYVKRTLIKTDYVIPSLLKRRKVSNLSVIKLEII